MAHKARVASIVLVLLVLTGRTHAGPTPADNPQLAAVSDALALQIELDLGELLGATTDRLPQCVATNRRKLREIVREECAATGDAIAFEERGGLAGVSVQVGFIAASIGSALRDAERNDTVVLTTPRPGDGGGGGSSNTSQTLNCVYRDAVIAGTADGNRGGVFVNQDTGRLNNQVNELAVYRATELEGLALSEFDLSQWNTGNRLNASPLPDARPVRDVVRHALNDNGGLAAGNQSVGALSNQGNLVTFTPVTGPRQAALPGTGGL